MGDRQAEIKSVSTQQSAKAAPVRLLLLCNETIRKRCQSLAALVQSAGQNQRGRRLLTARLKCVTYAEDEVNVSGAFSLSAKTDRLLADSDLTLCLLRVANIRSEAWRQLVDMLGARHPRYRVDKDKVDDVRRGSRMMLVQCCGAAYAVDDALESSSHTDPSSVDRRLRTWLAGHIASCQPDDLASISVDNSSAGKALRHRLLGKRYTVQVEFAAQGSASAGPRRHSLYRLTDGCEAANGGCSPEAIVKRCRSLGERLDCSLVEESIDCTSDDKQQADGHYKHTLFHLEFVKPTLAAPVTLVVAASRSCSVEAELCLNNLSSRGYRAVSIDAFAASLPSKSQQQQQQQPQQQRRGSTLRLLLTGGRRHDAASQLGNVLTRLTPETAFNAVFLIFCRRYRSRLLAELLRCVAQPSTPKITATPPQAAFAAIVGPVGEAECDQLRQLGSSQGQMRCQLDVVCGPEGLAGQRVLGCLVPGLAAMMRQLEVAAAAAAASNYLKP